MTKAAMNMHSVLYGHKFLFLWDQGLGVGFSDHIVSVCLFFPPLIAKLFSNMAVSFYMVSLNSERSGIFLHPCQHLVLSLLFSFSGSNKYVVIFLRGFNLHFPSS